MPTGIGLFVKKKWIDARGQMRCFFYKVTRSRETFSATAPAARCLLWGLNAAYN